MTVDRLEHVRPPRRQRKGLQTPNPEVRQRLMAAAAALINEGGYGALRIEEIAARADLSVGTFYLYFVGKSDLFVNLVQDYTERLRARMLGVGGSTPTAQLARSIDAYLDFVEENERAFLHFVRASGSMQTNHGSLSTWALNSHAADLLPGIEAAIRRGEARALNPVLVSQAMIGLTQHLVVFWLEHKDVCSREGLKAFLLSFVGYGIRAPGSRAFEWESTPPRV